MQTPKDEVRFVLVILDSDRNPHYVGKAGSSCSLEVTGRGCQIQQREKTIQKTAKKKKNASFTIVLLLLILRGAVLIGFFRRNFLSRVGRCFLDDSTNPVWFSS